jgi:hypothetical protein
MHQKNYVSTFFIIFRVKLNKSNLIKLKSKISINSILLTKIKNTWKTITYSSMTKRKAPSNFNNN